tara:strand:+ start:44 stop:691 length:648 start_codon:yes stop_codon:yes gene_type:complete
MNGWNLWDWSGVGSALVVEFAGGLIEVIAIAGLLSLIQKQRDKHRFSYFRDSSRDTIVLAAIELLEVIEWIKKDVNYVLENENEAIPEFIDSRVRVRLMRLIDEFSEIHCIIHRVNSEIANRFALMDDDLFNLHREFDNATKDLLLLPTEKNWLPIIHKQLLTENERYGRIVACATEGLTVKVVLPHMQPWYSCDRLQTPIDNYYEALPDKLKTD